MANLDAIRGRLNKLQNTQKKSDSLWKPEPGKTQIRIVPYKFNQDFPFIELYFHYGLNNKTYVSPVSFDRPDPIAEFAEKLKTMGTKEEWRAGKDMEPKLRTFAPVLVRGKENEGVKFWGFGKTVYQDILGYMADEDYGDITDPSKGRDITIDYKTAKEAGTNFPVTTIRIKPNASPIMDSVEDAKKVMNDQVNITDLYPEPTYEELKTQLQKFLSEDEEVDATPQRPTTVSQTISKPAPKVETKVADNVEVISEEVVQPTQPPAEKPASKSDDVESAFDDLFNN